jgi:ribosomal protein L9
VVKGFTIAAGNPLLGISNFLVITLPDDWNIKVGELPTEVNNSVLIGNVKWVTDGYAYHYIYNNEHAYQLKIKVHKSQKESQAVQGKVLESGEVKIASHKAYYNLINKDVGFIKKQAIQILYIRFYCENTNRTIELEITGKDISDELKNLVVNVQESICH